MSREQLRTARLVLRDLAPDDIEAVHAWASDPEVSRFMVWGPNTWADTQAFVQEQLAAPRNAHSNRLVELAGTGLVIGGIDLRIELAAPHRAEIGYVFNREHWNQGYATEAARAMIAHGFGDLGLERIAATCDPENQASAQVLRKAGLRPEGHLRHHLKVRGQWRDSLLFAVLSGDRRD